MAEKKLDDVYGLDSPEATMEFYEGWAGSYDMELAENGYATPGRCARALRQRVEDPATPLLDFGCGTGLSGAAFAEAGFTTIDGMDPSEAMLDRAREKDVYRKLDVMDVDDPAPVAPESYPIIAAVGVIGAGAAPLSTFGMLMEGLQRDGLLVLSFNDHTLNEPGAKATLNEWLDLGAARLLFSEHGPHLPKEGLESTVYVIEKA